MSSLVIHVITGITEVETIKQHTRGVYGFLVAGQRTVAARPIGCTPAQSVTNRATAAATCGAILVSCIYLLYAYHITITLSLLALAHSFFTTIWPRWYKKQVLDFNEKD